MLPAEKRSLIGVLRLTSCKKMCFNSRFYWDDSSPHLPRWEDKEAGQGLHGYRSHMRPTQEYGVAVLLTRTRKSMQMSLSVRSSFSGKLMARARCPGVFVGVLSYMHDKIPSSC